MFFSFVYTSHKQDYIETFILELLHISIYMNFFNYCGNTFIIVSKRADIIGIEIAIIITFPPKSILFAIALSPESLQMLTANSVKNAIPVIFNNITKNSLFILASFANSLSKDTIPEILSKIKNKIMPPAIREIYITNSGLYCLIIIIIINAVNPTPIIFNISTNNHQLL